MEKVGNKQFIFCSTCGTKVSSYWSLSRHTRTHSGVKPFKCKVRECGKEFIESCALRRHEQTHTDCRQWICDFQDCSRKFKLKEYLDIHKRSHREELNLACQPCNNDSNGSSVSSNNIYLGRFKRPYRERTIKKTNSKDIILKRCIGSSKAQSINTEKSAESNSSGSYLFEKNHFQQLISLHKMHDSLSYPSLPLPSPQFPAVHHPHSFPSTTFCTPSVHSSATIPQNSLVPDINKNDNFYSAFDENILNSATATTINYSTFWGISSNAFTSTASFPVHEYHCTNNSNILPNELDDFPIHCQQPETEKMVFSQQNRYIIPPSASPALEQQQYQYKEYYTTSLTPTPTFSAPHATDISSNEELEDFLQELQDDDLASIFHFDLEWDL